MTAVTRAGLSMNRAASFLPSSAFSSAFSITPEAIAARIVPSAGSRRIRRSVARNTRNFVIHCLEPAQTPAEGHFGHEQRSASYALASTKNAERVLIYPSFLALLTFVTDQPHTPTTEFVQHREPDGIEHLLLVLR